MKEKDISATAQVLKDEITASILKKLESIKDKIESGKGSTQSSYLQMLIMVDEDLDDVLLNWEYDAISSRKIGSYSEEPFDDELDDDF